MELAVGVAITRTSTLGRTESSLGSHTKHQLRKWLELILAI